MSTLTLADSPKARHLLPSFLQAEANLLFSGQLGTDLQVLDGPTAIEQGIRGGSSDAHRPSMTLGSLDGDFLCELLTFDCSVSPFHQQHTLTKATVI